MNATVTGIDVSAHRFPLDRPHSDGTLTWDSVTLVLVEANGGGKTGIGYTYADGSIAQFIQETLEPVISGRDVMSVTAAWTAMQERIRNLGHSGLAEMAVAAVDTALWDLKARVLGIPLVDLFGRVRDSIPIYGSGGFTSYSNEELEREMSGWAREGLRMMKMKVGREPGKDVERVRVAREAIGPDRRLMVDANGAYSRKQALEMAERFAPYDVTWFEEPVSSDDLHGLRLLRDRAPAGMEIAAGEYGFELQYFKRMIGAGAVDVIQADATRCGGYSNMLRVGAVSAASGIPLSAHTAPNLHAHVCCALPSCAHVEYFEDHYHYEDLLFEGALRPENGHLIPDRSRAGNGLTVKRRAAARFAA